MVWDKKEISGGQVKELAAKYGCDLLAASILTRRGVTSGDSIRYFLEDDTRYLRSPFLLPGMEDAVERILAAKEEGEKVLVFGDRDVDGVTSTALLAGYLKSEGMDVSWQVPSGDETYGLSIKAVEDFAAARGTLIITVDCGISNVAEIERAAELSVDVVVTDHHNPQDVLPAALALVNPKFSSDELPGQAYPFRDLSGCGVAYKLVQALRFACRSELYGQNIALFHTRPANDAWVVEIARMRNLCLVDVLCETLPVDGEGRAALKISDTRIPAFLEGQQILVWDAAQEKKNTARLFGKGVEIAMMDIAAEIGKEIPATAGMSLLRTSELSRIARYDDENSPEDAAMSGELHVFVNLFISFAQKREKFFTAADESDLQLACLGTIADIMPLKDENRIIVKRGLKALSENPRPGLQDLLFKLKLSGRKLSSHEVSWRLNPVLNAAGRMGCPDKAAFLLLEEDAGKRDRLADELIAMNEERKRLGDEAWAAAEKQAPGLYEMFNRRISAAWGPEIKRGVTGIIATRLAALYKCPALAANFDDSGGETGAVVTGSLRSAKNFDLRALMEPCADLFLHWGGHDYACGFSMERGNWDAFLGRLKTASLLLEPEESGDGEERLPVDAELPLAYLNADPDPKDPRWPLNVVDKFEPYGEANSELCFLSKGLKVADITLMGKPESKHVKLTLDAGKNKWPALYWQAADKVKRDFDIGDTVDLVFQLQRNFFNGNEIPQMVVSDLKRSGAD